MKSSLIAIIQVLAATASFAAAQTNRAPFVTAPECVAPCGSGAAEVGGSCDAAAIGACACPIFDGADDFCSFTCAGGTWSLGCDEENNDAEVTPEAIPETEAPVADSCVDTQGDWGFKTDCKYWASIGECEKNPGFMGNACPKSCNTCGVDSTCIKACSTSTAIELDTSCGDTAVGDCLCPLYAGADPFCGYTCVGGKWSIKCQDEEEAAPPAPAPAPVTPALPCVDKNTMCNYWAKLTPSECSVNPGYMNANCAKSCGTCAN